MAPGAAGISPLEWQGSALFHHAVVQLCDDRHGVMESAVTRLRVRADWTPAKAARTHPPEDARVLCLCPWPLP